MRKITLNPILFVVVILLNCLSIKAQEKVIIDSIYQQKKLEKSLSFAALTLGGDILGLTGGKIKNITGENSFGFAAIPRFTIGGQHFWGYADFYVTFPLPINIKTEKLQNTKGFKYSEGVETGFKIYPYAMRKGRLSPYVGMSFQPMSFEYSPENINFSKGSGEFSRFISPIQLGLTYSSKKYLFTAGVRYNWKNVFDFYESPTSQSVVTLNPFNFNVGIVKYMDTDISMAKPKAVEQLNLKYQILKKHNKLNAWYYAYGPSSALQMSKSPYFKQNHPYFYNNMMNSFLIPDITFGRYFYKYDFNIGVSTRAMAFKSGSFETEVKMQRATFAIEAYKFLGNYHGFVPFVGSMLSLEHLRFKENSLLVTNTKPALGFVFGWDIRVTDTGTGLLRTNLRYSPNLNMLVKEEKVMFDHLEFNFIQFVKFIGRGKVYRQYRSK